MAIVLFVRRSRQPKDNGRTVSVVASRLGEGVAAADLQVASIKNTAERGADSLVLAHT